LIRALAIRTMGCIRVDKVIEYLCEPLRNCLKDKDPYVRKTAAICVAKLHDMSPDLVESQGFLDMLMGLLSDSNPTVKIMMFDCYLLFITFVLIFFSRLGCCKCRCCFDRN
jgi:vesicle coat complex subunit